MKCELCGKTIWVLLGPIWGGDFVAGRPEYVKECREWYYKGFTVKEKGCSDGFVYAHKKCVIRKAEEI